MNLDIKIHNIKCITDLELSLPIEPGLYAITGQNGSGKSTVVTCAASAFYNFKMSDYFGKTDKDSFISFAFGKESKKRYAEDSRWKLDYTAGFHIKGFYEGSLIFGNRFRNTSYEKIRQLDYIKTDTLDEADEFIKRNLGGILQGNENFYNKVYLLPKRHSYYKSDLFFYEKNGKYVSQFHMSTGENLLITILDRVLNKVKEYKANNTCDVMFIDEIELALHPSSIKRLVDFLSAIAKQYNYAIYFSTHSLELINTIKPDNIFFLERHTDNTIDVINPCYPAYATRILYDHSGYDNVILVEDDLAKEIIQRILRKKQLLNSRLVHVLPCGGCINVINLANDVISNNLLGKKSAICIILDGDVKEQVEKQTIKNNIPLNYLPISCLEKFLKEKLVTNVDHALFRRLNDYLFLQKSLDDIRSDYEKNETIFEDKNGKKFYRYIENELRARNKARADLIEMVIDYLFEQDTCEIKSITKFLEKQFEQ